MCYNTMNPYKPPNLQPKYKKPETDWYIAIWIFFTILASIYLTALILK